MSQKIRRQQNCAAKIARPTVPPRSDGFSRAGAHGLEVKGAAARALVAGRQALNNRSLPRRLESNTVQLMNLDPADLN